MTHFSSDMNIIGYSDLITKELGEKLLFDNRFSSKTIHRFVICHKSFQLSKLI